MTYTNVSDSNESPKESNNIIYIPLSKFCELTELSTSYVYRLTSERKLTHYKPFGKKIYFRLDQVNEMFEASRVSSSEELKEEAVNYVFNSKK